MTSAIFIDANIPVYASGREHPYKEPCARILKMAAERPLLFVTNAEVLQRLGSDRIVSADTDFDGLPGVTRLDPADVTDWAAGLG